MKTLYTLRPSDGRVLRYTGSWTELGFLQGLALPRLNERMAVNWFKFKGELWCALLAEKLVFICLFENGNLVPTFMMPTAVTSAAWGNTVNYASQIRWLEQNETNTLLYSFDGQILSSQIVGIPQATAFSQDRCELTLAVFGNRLAVLPRKLSAGGAPGHVRAEIRNLTCLLDLTPNGISVTTAAAVPPPTLNADVAGADLREAMAGAGVYQDSLVALYADGVVGRVTGEARQPLGDVTKEAFVQAGRTATTAAGTTERQVMVNTRLLAQDGMPYLLGARVMVGSGPYAGQSGIVGSIDGAIDLSLGILSDSQAPFPALTANTEVTFGRGVAGGFCYGPMHLSTPGPVVHTFFFEVADALYGLVLGRQPTVPQKPTKQAQPSFLVRLRGSAVIFTPLQLAGQWLNVMSAQALLDASDSALHILAYDPAAAAVRHLRYGLASSTLSDQGMVYEAPTAVHLAAGNLIAYDDGELDVVLGSLEADSLTGDVTINYEIFGSDPTNSVVSFSYNIGGAWLPATKSPRAGAPNTFVHALLVDLPTFNGEIQYRADISRP